MLHILIVRLSSIGDVLHATTVAHNLRLLLPDAEISWLVSPPSDTLLHGNPDIDHLLVWDRRPIDQAFAHLHLRRAYQELQKAKALLAPYSFDIALDIQGLFLTGLLTKASGAKRRIGIHERHEGNPLFMTEMAPEHGDRHKIRRYLTALEPLGFDCGKFQPGIVLPVTDAQKDFAKSFWARHGVDPAAPILMVNTRTTWPDKNWPPAYFGAALRNIPASVQIVFSGAPGDKPFIAEAMRGMNRPALSIAGETSLTELAALIASATLLLTGDTGPLYIAEGVHTPTLSIWGPTHPDIYGPLTAGHHFVLSPHSCTACCKTHCKQDKQSAYSPCMRAVTPDRVRGKLAALLHLPADRNSSR